MPRDASSSSSRLIGRVGALAVALGIGAAMANSPGVAWAEPGDTGSAGASGSSASTGESTSDAGGKTPAGATPEATTGGTGTDPGTGTGTESGDADTDAESAPEPAKPTKTGKRNRGSGVTDKSESAADSGETATAAAAEATTAAAKASDTEPTSTARAVAAEPKAAPAEVQQTALSIATPEPPAAALDVTPAPTPSAPREPVDVVTQVVSGLLTAIGLTPQATGAPTTPAPSPAMWTMLGFVRREIGNVATPPVSVATPTTTSQPVAAALQATSPLGTQQQLDAEQTATATYHSLPVALMKLVLRFGFMSAAQQQFSLVGGPDQANIDRLDAAVNEYAMGAAFQQLILDSMNPTVVMQVAPPHTWYGQTVPGSRILYDNPDTVYRFMGVNGASSYVIKGRFDGAMPADTTFSVLTGLTGNTASVLTKDQLVLDPDGKSFTITVDSSPANGRPNHLQLTSDSTLIATRNTLSDWDSEQPMSLTIDRVGGPPPSLFSQLGGFAIPGLGPTVVNNPFLTTLVSLVPPLPFNPPILRGAVAAVIMALGIQREATYMAVATTDPATGQRIEPNVLKNPARNAEFLATQLQSAGYFQLADDEALVVTIRPNNARYFVVPVTDDWTITRDYWNEQTSLNISQAKVNPIDGSYTVVISKSDPTVGGQHVANWVSTGGLNQGTISMRFQDLDPNAPDDLPTVTSQVVKLDDLDTVLPANTVYLTDQGRADQLAARKAGYDNRFAPYPQP